MNADWWCVESVYWLSGEYYGRNLAVSGDCHIIFDVAGLKLKPPDGEKQ